jgi:hypothetical protein
VEARIVCTGKGVIGPALAGCAFWRAASTGVLISHNDHGEAVDDRRVFERDVQKDVKLPFSGDIGQRDTPRRRMVTE